MPKAWYDLSWLSGWFLDCSSYPHDRRAPPWFAVALDDGIRTDRIWLDTRLRATYGARASSHRVTVRLAEALEASRFGFFEQSTVLRKQSAGKTLADRATRGASDPDGSLARR
jgi:hypothetical protein